MATTRETKLVVQADVRGADDVQALADDLRGVGKGAAASAPELDRLGRELEALAAATARRRTEEATARAEAAAARRALNEQADALARLRAESDRATRETAAFQDAERRLRVAIVEARIAARDKAAAVAAAARESVAAAAAEREAAGALDKTAAAYRAAASAAAVSAKEQAGAVGGAVATIRGQLEALRNVAGVALGGSLVGSLAADLGQTADAYANLAARVRIATGEGAAFDSAFRGVFDVAQRTGTAVDDVGALFTKLVQAGRELNLTSADALRLAESVSQATQLSGASAQEAAASVTQFAQAIASGRLQGDELRSLLENAPRLAQALADGLGVATGQLRELGTAGALTATQVIGALQGQSQALQREFAQLPPTVGRAIANLSNQWTLYVGEVDKATGASSTAAAAINGLAGSLDTLGALLFSTGKAAAAYAALRLAQSFIESAGAARAAAAATAAATVATTAHTAAIAANTAAQAANAAAAVESVAVAGRMAGVFAALKTFTFLGVVTNLREIGTAIGEQAAKWAGWGKAIEDAERATRADEQAARANAAAKAALAQSMQQATDRALGLNREARALVAEFEGLRAKGESVADALKKIDLDLGDIKGIQVAGAALDALGQRGQLAGREIREALAGALNGRDLAVFETQARAAFDSTTQGARRLQSALDAIASESIRRAGTSLEELTSGFSAAAVSALNDVDALARSLRDLRVSGDDAGRALAVSLNRATDAAATERAVQAVIDRITELGKAGAISGEQLAAALEKARKKADELRPGIDSLAEALRTFGLRTQTELQATADKLAEAYRVIASSVGVSIAQQVEAFKKWREAALSASGGVESGQLAVQRVILENKAAALGFGQVLESAMNGATAATNRATDAQTRYNAAVVAGIGAASQLRSAGGQGNKLAADGGDNLSVIGGSMFTLNGQVKVPPGYFFDEAAANKDPRFQTGQIDGSSFVRPLPGTTSASPTKRDPSAVVAAYRRAGIPVPPGGVPLFDSQLPPEVLRILNGEAETGTAAPQKASVARPNASATPSRVVRVEHVVSGRTYAMTTDAPTADGFVSALEQAKRTAGA